MDTLEQISQVLLDMPLACEFRSIAQYYQGLCVKRKGEVEGARALFERVAEEAPLKYRARAIIALGSVAFDSGDFRSALPFYIEAGKAAIHRQGFDPLAAFYTLHMLAVLRSIDGDNRGALEDLERIFPLARAVGSLYPPVYYNYLNSRAVGLAELGRLEEAARVCQITLAPSFADVYPEYRETWNDIALRGRRPSRSSVYFAQRTRNPENVLRLPAPELGDSFSPVDNCFTPLQQSARILNYAEWKNKMVKEPNGNPQDNETSEKLDDRQKMLKIIQLVSQPERTDQELESILEAVERIVSKPEDKDAQ
jgi:tetratricopeptide (TPR) repeat protein